MVVAQTTGMAVEMERGGLIQDTFRHLHGKNIAQEQMERRTTSFEKEVLCGLPSDKI